MDSTQTLDIKVVYSATKGASPRKPVSVSPAGGSPRWLGALGLSAMVVAASLCFAAWWRVDTEIRLIWMFKTPVQGLNPDSASKLFEDSLTAGNAHQARPENPQANPSSEPRIVGVTARNVIVGTGVVWLAVVTIACCALTFAAGTVAGRNLSGLTRGGLACAAMACLAGMCWIGFGIWQDHKWGYEPRTMRIGMSSLVVLFAVFGAAVGNPTQKKWRTASLALIASAVASILALYLGKETGAIKPEYATLTVLVTVFVAQSFYGWILWPIASRVRS